MHYARPVFWALLILLLYLAGLSPPEGCLPCLWTWLLLQQDYASRPCVFCWVVACPACGRCLSCLWTLLFLPVDVARPASGRCSSCFWTLLVLLVDVARPASGNYSSFVAFFNCLCLYTAPCDKTKGRPQLLSRTDTARTTQAVTTYIQLNGILFGFNSLFKMNVVYLCCTSTQHQKIQNFTLDNL